MSTAKRVKPRPIEITATPRVVNTTDATRGEPLAMRARERKAELQRALDAVPTGDARARHDLEAALAAIDGIVAGDIERLPAPTAAELTRWLQASKHMVEIAPPKRRS